jgi:hypothetical protein
MRSCFALATFCLVITVSSVAIDGLSADQETSGKTEVAKKSLERGRMFKQRGQFRQAWEQFEIARQIAPQSSPYRQQAEQELNYHLPLMEIQHRVNVGDLDGAEQLLNELLVINQSTPSRLTELNTMLQNLKVMRSAGSGRSISIDHNAVVEQVRRILEEYRRARGRYPVGYRELNDTLPPNRPPLQHFLVGRYEGTGGGYLLVLRNRYNTSHVLTIQNTGMLR